MNRYSVLMRRTIEIARENAYNGQLPFAAILTRDDLILAEAGNSVVATGDVTRHAVMNLASTALHQLSPNELQKCTVVCSCEPCPMCAGLIYWLGVTSVVFGCSANTWQQICGQSVTMPCSEVFRCCHPVIEAIGPIAEDPVAELLLEFWPHPT